MSNFLVRNKKYFFYGGALVILVLALFFILKNGKTTTDTLMVAMSDFVNKVSVSGKVGTTDEADLAFASSGRIGRIYVKNNQVVKEGQILAQLEIGDLLADLRIKELNAKTSDVGLEDAKQNLEKVTEEENEKVESTYRKLLSDNLVLSAEYRDVTMSTPLVTGAYRGEEGQYKIIIDQESVSSPDYLIRTFGLEKTERVINKIAPTALGTKGLYIDFPDELVSYVNTIWYLDIPNKSSSSYLANLSAHNEAVKARGLAIKNAEFDYQKLLTQEENSIESVTRAEIDKIRAEIRKSTIYAPFDGVVTNVDKEVGETVGANESIVSVIGEGVFEIESFVPEVKIALIKTGDAAQVTLDAYGESVLFQARVISIDLAETERDGVSTYKVKLLFDDEDQRIKAGMTANVSIILFEKPNTIVLPLGTIFEENGKKYVKVRQDKNIINREVVIGESSALGQVEILSGLSPGELVLLTPVAE
jgi:HlyD family secretion protein